MKKLSMAAAITSVALLMPGLAAADSFNYAAVKGGWTQVRENHFDQDAGDQRVHSNYKDGFTAAFAIGRQYSQGMSFNLRTELEIGYQQADVDRQNVTDIDRSGPIVQRDTSRANDPEGEFSMAYAFVSVYGEQALTLVPNTSFIFGAGAGAAQVTFEDYGFDGVLRLDDDDISYGFHLTTGWAYHINDRISLEATYRYISIEDVRVEAEDGTSDRQRVDSHNLMAGIRVGF